MAEQDPRAGRKIPVRRYVDWEEFTPRQQDVIREVANGKTGPEVADSLDLSLGTVRNYIKAIAGKIPGSAQPMKKILIYGLVVDEVRHGR